MKREGVPTLGRSLSFDFLATMVRLLTTIERLSTTFWRLCNDFRLSGDFATISDFSDFRTDGGDPDVGAVLGVSMEIPRGSTFVAVSGPGSAASRLLRRVSRREIVGIYHFERLQAFLRRLIVSACL